MRIDTGHPTTARSDNTVSVADIEAGKLVVYDVVLLAGSPRRYTMELAADLGEGSTIDLDGERWTIADVRNPDGAPPQLICIYPV
jgi:hypothetical protein